jgi:hypothetical protein
VMRLDASAGLIRDVQHGHGDVAVLFAEQLEPLQEGENSRNQAPQFAAV